MNITYKNCRLACLFAFYTFAFLLTEITVNMRAAVLWSESSVLGVYAGGLVCTGSGYIVYTFVQRNITNEKYRKFALLMASIVATMGIGVLLFTSGTIAIPAGWLALFCMGFLAAAIYYYMSCALLNNNYTGRIIGISMFLAVVLQYAVMNFFKGEILILMVLSLSVAGICSLIWNPLGDWCFEDALPYEQNPPTVPQAGIVAAIMVALMTFGFAFSDECVTFLDSKGELNVAAWPRLFYGAGLLIAGYLVDIGKRRYIYMITGIAFSLALLSPALLVPKFYNASMSVMYLYSGFYVMFLTTAFFDVAPKTSEPWLWAGMGRIVRSFTTAAVIFPADLVMSRFGIWGVIFANALATIGILLLVAYVNEQRRQAETKKLVKENEIRIARMDAVAKEELELAVSVVRQEALKAEERAQQRFDMAQSTARKALMELEEARNALDNSRAQVQALQESQDKAPKLQNFAELHELTPREKEVLELILSKEGTGKELAKELLISERVFQRYLTSIYDKTGTNSRVGLILYYYGQ